MSNFLAIATVSAAIQLQLADAVSAAVGGAEVWVDRSDVKRQKPGVNIYMYRAANDPARRNDELPARRTDGSLMQKPKAALRLHYLLTFHGKDDLLEPQRLMGATIAALHTRPLITKDLIDDVVASAVDAVPSHAYLALTDLADADEIVRLSPDPLDLEDLSKLWSVFFQSPYQLSATYVAAAVLVEEQAGDVTPAPPVLESGLVVRPLLKPRVESARDATNPRGPIVADSVLRVVGSGLKGDVTLLRIGPGELAPADADTTATSILVDLSDLPAGMLRAGLQPLVVVHRWRIGAPPEQRAAETSNVVGVLVSPRIVVNAAGGALTATSDVTVGPRQQAAIALLTPATGATAHLLDVPARETDSTEVTVSLAGVPPGTYGVSLAVDGAQSPVTRGPSGKITAPLVTV
jgi:hypothetical protein